MERFGTRTPAFAKQKYAGFGVASEIKKSSEAIFLYKRAEERNEVKRPLSAQSYTTLWITKCYNPNSMYFYFDKNKYYVSAKKYPYISNERINRYNDSARELEQLTKIAAKRQSDDEKSRTSISLIIGVALCVAAWGLILSYMGKDGYVLALVISLPILGLCYGVLSQSLPVSSELRLLESSIKEKTEHLNSELLVFDNLKKRQAQYWLSMDGWQFEKEIAKLYEAHGYHAVVTKGSDDGGIDIFLAKNGTRLGVQCKNHSKPVAQAVIRELAGAMLHENLDGGIVIASSGYTKRAKEFVENKPIKLLDIHDVLRMHAGALSR